MSIQAVPLLFDQGDTYIDCDHIVDGAGNRFVAYGEAAGNDTWASIKRYATSGAVTGEWEVLPSENQKIDEVTLAHSGDVLLVLLTTHAISSVKPRAIHVESAAIPGVYSVRLGMETEEGASGAFQPTGEPDPEPGGGGVTKEEVEAVVNFVVDQRVRPFIEEWARTTIANLIPKTKAGVEQLFDGAAGSSIVYQQLINTSYTGALGAIRDSDKPQEEPTP